MQLEGNSNQNVSGHSPAMMTMMMITMMVMTKILMRMMVMVVMLSREDADSSGDDDNEGDYDDAYAGSMKMCSWSKFPKNIQKYFSCFSSPKSTLVTVTWLRM